MKTILTVMAAVVLLCCCGGGKTGPAAAGGLEFDSVVADTAFSLVPGGTPRCELHLSIVYAKGKGSDSLNQAIIHGGILSPDYLGLTGRRMSVPEAVDSFMRLYVSDYRKTFGDICRQEPSSATGTQYRVKTRVEDGRDGTVVYIADVYQYEGGAHGSATTVARNIDPRTGRVLTLKDVFVAGAEDALRDMIVEKLRKKAGAGSLEELQEKGYFMDINPYVSDNFILGEDELTFIYCADEIGPHALGEIRVEVGYTDIDKYLK